MKELKIIDVAVFNCCTEDKPCEKCTPKWSRTMYVTSDGEKQIVFFPVWNILEEMKQKLINGSLEICVD